jgi:ribosomal-protein-alanine N-acetyltransferase
VETGRCILTKLNIDDFEDVKKIYVNEEVRKYLGGAIPEENTLSKFMDTLNRSNTDSHFWAVRLKESKHFIGLVSLDKHVDGGTELSYEFVPTYWGTGYATEVIRNVIIFAFNELTIFKVIAETQTANASSCRLLERVGMTLERKVQRFGAEQTLYSIEKTGKHYSLN